MKHSRFGLIGHPIAHSLSPALFKAGYDGKYPYDLIEGDDFEASYQRFIEEYDGINVTAPFKELAFAKADIVSEECAPAKAANLLVKTPEGVKAYNSDLLGVRLWLQEVLHKDSGDEEGTATSWAPPPAARGVARFPVPSSSPESPTVLVVGTGGAGKAAAVAAASLGLHVILMNRSFEKATSLAESLNEAGYEVEAKPMEEFRTCFRNADIIIYNIPAAIPQMEELTGSDFGEERAKYTLEANYKDPAFDEAFVKRMTEANPLARHTGGRTWLLYQALTGYEIFTGEKPDLRKMSDVL